MISLLLSILSSTLIFVLFKHFERSKVQLFTAIVANYGVSFLFGISLAMQEGGRVPSAQDAWPLIGLSLGVLFISIFYLMGLSSQRLGVGVTSVAVKMSLVLPAFGFAWLLPNQSIAWTFVVGLVLALLAIVLVNYRKEKQQSNKAMLWIPVIIFLGSGIIDFSIGYVQKTYLQSAFEEKIFASLPFLGAFTVGIVVLIAQSMRSGEKPTLRSILWGAVLGIVNYFSIYFLLQLFSEGWLSEKSAIPVNNLGVVMASTIAGLLLFKEQLNKFKILGLLVAIGSLVLLLVFQ